MQEQAKRFDGSIFTGVRGVNGNGERLGMVENYQLRTTRTD